MLDTILVVDALSENSEHLELAIGIADDWIQKYVITATKDEFAWYDMAVGQRATKLSYMLRRLIELDFDEQIIFRFILASHIHLSELLERIELQFIVITVYSKWQVYFRYVKTFLG